MPQAKDKGMYYLDLHKLYKQTTKEQRVAVRKTLDRDERMLKLLKLQHNTCFYCMTPIDMSGHLDHLIPVYYGGTNRFRNLVASCRSCNITKLTDQLEITNVYTIARYKKYIREEEKLRDKPYRHKRKRYQLYHVYRADLFREI